jgi:hypothetical protein
MYFAFLPHNMNSDFFFLPSSVYRWLDFNEIKCKYMYHVNKQAYNLYFMGEFYVCIYTLGWIEASGKLCGVEVEKLENFN